MKSLFAVVKNNLTVTQVFIFRESVNDANNKVLVLTRKIKDPVTIHLEFTNDNCAYVRPPRYAFKSVSSHCDYTAKEERWTRRKDVIYGLVKALDKAGIWPFISNKNFFHVNENCKMFLKKKDLKSRVVDEIHEILTLNGHTKSRKAIKDLDKQATELLKLK